MIIRTNSNIVPVPQMPVGIPFPWFTEDRPDGTILLEGQAFLATDYPELAKVYPSLTLPDMRDVVPRGMSRGRGLNPDASGLPVGSYQGDEFKSHTHSISRANVVGAANFAAGADGYVNGGYTDSTGGTETRGKAILCYWICYVRSMYYDLSVEGGNANFLGGHPPNYYASKQDVVNNIKTWVAPDGNSWYRKYPDGWIEQGGKTLVSASDVKTTILYPQPLVIVINGVISIAGNAGSTGCGISTWLTSADLYQSYSSNAVYCYWSVKGRWK